MVRNPGVSHTFRDSWQLCTQSVPPLTFSLLCVISLSLSLSLPSPLLHTHTHTQDYLLGYESTSDLGAVGAMLEVALIVYFMCASVVGLYSTPRLKWLLPILRDTSMTKVCTCT